MNDGSDAPRARPYFAHTFQSFAKPLVQALSVDVRSPVYPDVLHGPPRIAHTFQSFAKPLVQAPAPVVPVLTVYPDVLRGPPRLAHTFQFFATPTHIVGAFPGYGPAGAATFILSLEGAKLTYNWGTDIFKSYSGAEQRCNTTGPLPRQRFEASAFLLDGPGRDLRSVLQRAASQGSTFLLALSHEELATTADSTGTTLAVASTATSDWAVVTQRVVVIDVNGTTTSAVIQAVTPTTIRLDVSPATRTGARIMPLIPMLLDPQQGFSRYPVNVELWSIRGTANAFGWVGQDLFGIGTQILTYALGPVSASALTDSDLLIWDRSNAVDGTAAESMLTLSETVDFGGLPFSAGGADAPDWARPIRYSSADPNDWQWIKAFLRQTRGRQRAFLLSTHHADLLYVSATGTVLKVQSSSATGAGDYTEWYTSHAHRRLALTKTDGSIQYVAVMAMIDNHDGTLSLILDASVTGTVFRVSFLEQARFDNGDSDDFPVTWDGGVFSVDLIARTTAETAFAFGYPTTAAEMAAACHAGTWTAGYLCEDSGSPLTAAFGGTNLPEGGSPAYRIAGPLGDRAVRISLTGTGFAASGTSFLDVDATKDLCGVVVMRSQLPLSSITYILSKSDFAGGPGYALTMNSTVISIAVEHASPGNVTASASVPDTILANNEWFAVMFVLERGSVNAVRVAIQSLGSGLLSIGSTQSTASIGSLSNLAAPFRINRSGSLGNTLEVAALYMGVGVGAASGMSAGLAAALASFVTYLGA